MFNNHIYEDHSYSNHISEFNIFGSLDESIDLIQQDHFKWQQDQS